MPTLCKGIRKLCGKAFDSALREKHPMDVGAVNAYKQALLTAAASALGITDQALKADLSQGMTLSQIAAAQKPAVTEAEFRTRLLASLTPLLDKAVAGKQLTPAQEKAIVKRLQAGPIPYWNKPMPAAKPAATTTPTS